MEIRARYTLIGLFTLSAIIAAFAFVYWLNNASGLTGRDVYRVRYENTVSGLLKGSAVLFNGIRVGEVTDLELDPGHPKQIMAILGVNRSTPVRADTVAGIEFQGLTGAPVVSLRGGSATAGALQSENGTPPTLVAKPDAGESMTEAARGVLQNINGVVTDNSKPFKELIANFNTFAEMLAKNKDRIDGILGGLERMTGGGKKSAADVYDLAAATKFPGVKKIPTGQLVVGEPEVLGALFNDEIAVESPDGERSTTLKGKWPDTLSRVVQTRIVQSFENANYLDVIGRQPDTFQADYQLLVDVRSFKVVTAAEPYAEMTFAGKVVGDSGKILGAKIFSAKVPTSISDEAGVAAGLNAAFTRTVTELVTWTCNTLTGGAARPAAARPPPSTRTAPLTPN
jgi:phospholipid/cholesterol/gamma-HCH transport system substrate-binding protein